MSNDKTLATVKHGGCVQLGTPGSRWAASGEPDPHGTRYDCECAALVLGDLTDDELANAVFMHGNERQTMAELVGGATPAITYLTAAKDRIRWLSRALAAAESLSAQPSPGGQGDALAMIGSNLRSILSLCKLEGQPVSKVDAANIQHEARHALQLLDLAARQPVGEPVAVEVPQGAIINGAAFADRLEHDYQFECPAGPLANCTDYVEFRRCFDYLAQWASSLPPLYAAPTARAVEEEEPVAEAWIVVKEHVWDHGDGGRPTLAYLWPSEFERGVYPSFAAASEFIKAGDWPLGFVAMQIEAPPAQAVDLGQFRAQVAVLLRSEFDLEVADPEDHRNDDGAGEADRIASKIAALIDSQAVGNG